MSNRNQPLSTVGEALVETCGDLWLINLASRKDRREEFEVQLSRIGLSLDHPQVHLFAANRPDEAGPFSDIGARGCFMSHLGVLRQALASRTERLLICEDDLNFTSDFVVRGDTVLSRLAREDWDVFYGFPPQDAVQDDAGVGLFELAPNQGVMCTHFIALRQAAIEALVPYLEAMLARPAGDPAGGPMHVDGAYSWFRREHPRVRTFVATPPLGYQRSSRTDISAPSLKDQLPLIRTVMRHARRLKNWIAARRDSGLARQRGA